MPLIPTNPAFTMEMPYGDMHTASYGNGMSSSTLGIMANGGAVLNPSYIDRADAPKEQATVSLNADGTSSTGGSERGEFLSQSAKLEKLLDQQRLQIQELLGRVGELENDVLLRSDPFQPAYIAAVRNIANTNSGLQEIEQQELPATKLDIDDGIIAFPGFNLATFPSARNVGGTGDGSIQVVMPPHFPVIETRDANLLHQRLVVNADVLVQLQRVATGGGVYQGMIHSLVRPEFPFSKTNDADIDLSSPINLRPAIILNAEELGLPTHRLTKTTNTNAADTLVLPGRFIGTSPDAVNGEPNLGNPTLLAPTNGSCVVLVNGGPAVKSGGIDYANPGWFHSPDPSTWTRDAADNVAGSNRGDCPVAGQHVTCIRAGTNALEMLIQFQKWAMDASGRSYYIGEEHEESLTLTAP